MYKVGSTTAGLSRSPCSIGWAEDPHDLHCLPAGGMFMFGGSSLHTMGSTAFLNNNAEDDGGKQYLL